MTFVNTWKNIEEENYRADLRMSMGRLCIVFTGQPRYVGNTTWENRTVELYKNIKKVLGCPVDIFFIIADQYQHKQKKIMLTSKMANKQKFQDYVQDKFSWADHCEVVWYDPVKLAMEYYEECEIGYHDSYGTLGYLNQHASLEILYKEKKLYFDSLGRNSVVLKTRSDIWAEQFGKVNYTNWQAIELLTIFLLQSIATLIPMNHRNSNDFMSPNHDMYFVEHDTNKEPIDLYPAIVTPTPMINFIRGSWEVTDMYGFYDPTAFRIYATKFKKWTLLDPITRLWFCWNADARPANWSKKHSRASQPEQLMGKFYLDHYFTLMPTIVRQNYFINMNTIPVDEWGEPDCHEDIFYDIQQDRV
jgi:hypothetical protein